MEDIKDLIRLEVESLTERIREGRKSLTSRAAYRSELESQNLALRDQIQRNLHTLRSEESLLLNMEVRQTELSGRTGNLGHLRHQIEVRTGRGKMNSMVLFQDIEERIRQERSSLNKVSWRDYQEDLRRSETHFRESEKRMTRWS